MWTYEHSAATDKSPESIWARYVEPARWPEWDRGLRSVTFDRPMEEGAVGWLTPASGPSVPFTVVLVDPGRAFVDRTEVNGLVIDFAHRLATGEDGRTIVTHGVTITGPAADTAGPEMGPLITADIPASIDALVRSA